MIKQRDDNLKISLNDLKDRKNTQDDVYWIQAMREFQVTFRLFSFKLFVLLEEKNKLVVCHGKLFAREFHSDEKMSSCFTRVFGLGSFKIHFVRTDNSLTRLPKTIDVRSNKGVIN